MILLTKNHSIYFFPRIILIAILVLLPLWILGCDEPVDDPSDHDVPSSEMDENETGSVRSNDSDEDAPNYSLDNLGNSPNLYNPDGPGAPEGYYYPSDYEFDGEVLVVLFTDLDGSHAGVGEFERKNNSWQLIHWLHSTQIEGGLTFPHTIELTKRGYLIGDSQAGRVIEVDKWGNLFFSYKALYPNEVMEIQEGFIVSWTDMVGKKGCGVEIVSRSGDLIWRYDTTVDFDGPAQQLHNGSVLANGNILMAICPDMGGNEGYGFALEVDRDKKEVWRFQDEFLYWPRNARRLENGNTLIAHGEGIWEVDPKGNIVWTFESADAVFNVLRLEDGITIANQYNTIIWISPEGKVIDAFVFNGDENYNQNG